MGLLHWWMLLPIALFWPNIFLGGTANALKWAHCIGGCYYYWLHFGLLFFWKALPMHSGGPIALGNTAPDGFALAHYFSRGHCQCTQVGPLYWWMLLPMASFWLIIFLGGTTNALRWAHCISRCCCRWLHFGPLSFCEALPMHSHGPIALVNAAANGFTLIPKYRSQICFRYRWIAVKQNVPLDLLFSVRFHKHTLLHQPIFYLNYAATQYASAGGVCADQCP